MIKKLLVGYAVSLFPMMQAVRFLTDYLNGDTYYKTLYPEHNLVRTRNQLRFFQEVELRRESGALRPDRHY